MPTIIDTLSMADTPTKDATTKIYDIEWLDSITGAIQLMGA